MNQKIQEVTEQDIWLAQAKVDRILKDDSHIRIERKKHLWDILQEKWAGPCDQVDMEAEAGEVQGWAQGF